MTELPVYQFPSRPTPGVLFGLSLARLLAIGAGGIVVIVTLSQPSAAGLLVAVGTLSLIAAAVGIKVRGRAMIDWLPVWVAFGWAQATRNNEFYANPDVALDLPDGVLDLPGELFGIEIHHYTGPTRASVANATPTAYGIVKDTFRHRLVAVAQIAGDDFLFCDPADQQARIAAWGGFLDHIAQALPDVTRLQIVHTVEPTSTADLRAHHRAHGQRGTPLSGASYRQVVDVAGEHAQQHRMMLAIALDTHLARRAVRQAGGGRDGAAAVLMDRAAVIEETLRAAGLDVRGWLPAPALGRVLRQAFDPTAVAADDSRDAEPELPVNAATVGPTGMADGWSSVRHDSGWSTNFQVARPPSRPVTGEFLQHLLLGVPARHRMSLLYVPTPAATAERRAQTLWVPETRSRALTRRSCIR